MTPLPQPLAPRLRVPVRIIWGPFDWPAKTLRALAAMTVDVHRLHITTSDHSCDPANDRTVEDLWTPS